MAVLPTFDPQSQAFGRTGTAVIGGMEAGQSMMERQQAMKLRDQQSQLQLAEFQAKLPLIAAQVDLTRTNAQTAIKNATERTMFEKKAAEDSVAFNQEFQNILSDNAAFELESLDPKSPTYEQDLADQAAKSKYAAQQTLADRAARLSALSAKAGYMKQLPAYQGFVDAVNKSMAETYAQSMLQNRLDEMQAQMQMRTEMAKTAIEGRTQVAQIGAGARVVAAQESAASRVSAATISAEARRDAAKAVADKNYEFERTKELRDNAIASGDQEAAQLYQDRLNKMNSSSGVTMERALPAAKPAAKPVVPTAAPVTVSVPGQSADTGGKPAVEPTGVNVDVGKTPTPVLKLNGKKPPHAVTIDGADYPVFVDKNGNAAYMKDGVYVPIKTD